MVIILVQMRRFLLFAGVALLAFLLWRLGPAEILGLLRRVGWYFLLAALLYTAHHAARALALRLSVVRPHLLGYGDALAIRLSGEAIQSLTSTGPLVSEPAKAWLLTRHGLTAQEGFAAAIAEYLINAFVAAALSIVALVYLMQRVAFPPLADRIAIGIIIAFSAFLVASVIAIVRRFYLIGTILAGLAKIGALRGRLRPDIAWINRMEDLLLAILRERPGRLLLIALIEVAAQMILVLELFWLLRALETPASPFFAFLLESSVKAIGFAFSFIPLQVGVAEGTYALVFELVGLPAAVGFAAAFLRRIRSLVAASAGLGALTLLTRGAPSRRAI
ncbi:MAG: hypothetical protein A3F70_04530 [Acidobacteria bacterium RIFCSPLOWO2_12_FULL_67_14]|nr:MAG: hypothetical protein A3F70_04530 [Acidobacteria bacterium RIFCSPLOWO2_12_FULL_67_14]